MPLAYFITYTTYGTWLHGTEKALGSVDRKHNVYGTAFLPPDPSNLDRAKRAMAQPPYMLDAARRSLVCDALVTFAREKLWHLHALHVRGNHIHVVITADRDPARLMGDLKARASRDLTRAGFDTPDRIRWTRHGSTRHLFDEVAIAQAVQYTLNEQGERMAYFDIRETAPG
jgi:REP element-mobilizing transposase RayT